MKFRIDTTYPDAGYASPPGIILDITEDELDEISAAPWEFFAFDNPGKYLGKTAHIETLEVWARKRHEHLVSFLVAGVADQGVAHRPGMGALGVYTDGECILTNAWTGNARAYEEVFGEQTVGIYLKMESHVSLAGWHADVTWVGERLAEIGWKLVPAKYYSYVAVNDAYPLRKNLEVE